MRRFLTITVSGVAAVLAVDASVKYGMFGFTFDEDNGSFLPLLIYLAVGYAAFRCCGLIRALAAAGVIVSVDVTLGWYISWRLWPGGPPALDVTDNLLISLYAAITLSTTSALLGSALARMLHGARRASPQRTAPAPDYEP